MTVGGQASRPAISGILGAFGPLHALRAMRPSQRRGLLKQLRDAGLSMFLTEGTSIPEPLEHDVVAAGLRLAGGMACFSDHAGAFRPVPDTLRPLTAAGSLCAQREWYRGIIPTDRGYEDDLVRACSEAASQPSLSLFTLDFIRWPLHWELELRQGAVPQETSFDPMTLARFRDEMNVDVPVDDPRMAAEEVASRLRPQWTAFKCLVITSIVERIVSAIRSTRPGLPIGAFIVPGDDAERRRHAGQDVAAIGEHVDVLLPMAYHAILRRTPDWVGAVVTDIEARTSTPVVPVVQATADRAVAGQSDWGAPFPPHELGQAIDAGLEAGGVGFVVFPAHGLDAERMVVAARAAARARARVAPRGRTG